MDEYQERALRLRDAGITREQLDVLWEAFDFYLKCGRDEAATTARDECRNGVSDRAWQIIRELVFQRDGHRCQYCGSTQSVLHCDHVIPLSKGGTTVASNLTTACASCNSSKKDKLLSEWQPSN